MGTTLIALLSSVFSAFAADPIPKDASNESANISNSADYGSIILIDSSGDRCFADKIYGRSKPDKVE